ncbi:hypothetical protein [Sandaracinus amylolyticus]|uniref:hypothetical protein n=1 Tax=Sandaracinus amylolyticus TaxID=927083 RepID=UPI001F4137F5|nr:hypothetical protein [Sandaracinus amylolyticus]UJR82435.1 Hypothetical protein I5071_45000 [Sandaracinus amylolyticus]
MRRSWSFLGVLLACAACSDPAPAPEPIAPAPSAPSDAEETPAPLPASWPTDVEDLSTAIEHFESVAECLANLRAHTPTLAAEALGDLGYDAFFDDACRALDAVHRRDAAACDALSVSTARRGCRRRLAMIAGDPTVCPEDLAIEGREPRCVAWAARDPSLCDAEAIADRATCVAVLAGEASRCPPRDRARCEAWVRRYARALGTERVSREAREPAELHLDVTRVLPPPASGGAPVTQAPIAIDLPQLARGVRLRADGCTHRVMLDERGAPDVLSTTRAGLRAELDLPSDATLPLERAIGPLGASIEVAVPRVGRAGGGEGTFTITTLDRTLGGAFAGTFHAELPLAPGALRVEGRFRTFVRDLDALPSHCPGGTMRD